MIPKIAEALLFLLPLPIIIGTIGYLIWHRHRYALVQAIEDADFLGEQLATQIAEYLEGGLVLAFQHRDYCGVGIRFAEGRFIYGQVSDGELPIPSELTTRTRKPSERLEYQSREEFVSWLATQTTLSLEGDGNQRLTKRRLLNAVKFCSSHPKVQWARYAG